MANVRQQLLQTLVDTSSQVVATPASVQQQATAVAQIVQVPSQLTTTVQQQATQFVSALLNSSLTTGITSTLPATVTNVLSNVLSSPSNGAPPLDQTTSLQLVQSVNLVVQNQLQNMVCGQHPMNTSSSHIAISTFKASPSQLSNQVLSGPPNSQLGSFQLPGQLNASSACMGVQYSGFSVDPFSFAAQAANVSSSVVSLTLRNQDGTLMVGGLSDNVTITLPLTTPLNSNQVPILSYYNYSGQLWSSSGCSVTTVLSNSNTIIGTCSHLTDFAIVAGPVSKPSPASMVCI